MIELFDAGRLTIKRDRSLALASGTLLFTAGVMTTYTGFLHLQLRHSENATQTLQNQLAALATPAGAGKAAASPRTTLIAELRRQAEQLEREAAINSAYGGPGNSEQLLSPAQWMQSLAELAQADTSLQKVDVERSGSARVEGVATHTQALNKLVQAWERQELLAQVQPRTLDIRQEKLPATFLRFLLRAAPSTSAAASVAAAGGPTEGLAVASPAIAAAGSASSTATAP